MERSSHFDLNREISQYLAQINAHHLLSRSEEDELTDHLMCEIESLEAVGLSTEEAFFLGQKRLGHTDLVQSEYQKAKPWSRVLQLFTLGLLFIFGIKFALNMIRIVSTACILLVSNYSEINLLEYGWLDLIFKSSVMLGALLVIALIIKKSLQRSVKVLWIIPLIFLISEIIGIIIIPYSYNLLETELFAKNQMHYSYIYFVFGIAAVIIACWGIWQNRKRIIQLA